MERYTDILRGHPGRVFELALESGEPLIVTVGGDNTVIAAFPDRRRLYRHTVDSGEIDLSLLADQPGFTILHSMPGVLVFSAGEQDAAYVWHLEDAQSSEWVRP
jgi:hypothetical protein